MPAADYSLFRPDLWLRVCPLAVVIAISTLMMLGTSRLLLARARKVRVRLDDRGTTELEFTIAFPFFLVSVLITVQAALMLNANLVVDYAAFCAVRSASVWIPSALPGEAPNLTSGSNPETSEKIRRVHTAAAVAVIPISPRATTFRFGLIPRSASTDRDAEAVGRLAHAVKQNEQAGVAYGRLAIDLLDKWPYANWGTNVSLRNSAGEATRQFVPSEPIVVHVTHKFEMAVPFAGHVLGAALGERYFGWLGGYYVPITASYALMSWPQ